MEPMTKKQSSLCGRPLRSIFIYSDGLPRIVAAKDLAGSCRDVPEDLGLQICGSGCEVEAFALQNASLQ